jgi:hypothetical protein
MAAPNFRAEDDGKFNDLDAELETEPRSWPR